VPDLKLDTIDGLELLWSGELVLLAVVLLSVAGPVVRAAREAGPLPWLIAAAIPAAIAWILPPDMQGFAGHERVLNGMLHGLLPDLTDPETHSMSTVPQALAWALSTQVDGAVGDAALLWVNRLSAGVVALMAGLLAVPGGEAAWIRRWTAATLGALSVLAVVPLMAWSATVYAVAPAAALGLAGLLLAQRGHRGRGLLLLAFAFGCRVEWLGVLLGVWVGGPAEEGRTFRRSAALGGMIAGLLAIGSQGLVFRSRPGGMALSQRLDGTDLVAQAVDVAPLASGALTALGLISIALLLVILARRGRPSRVVCLVLGAVGAALFAVLARDLATRHFIPAALLLGTAAVAAASTLPGRTAALGLLVLPALLLPISNSAALHHGRWMQSSAPDAALWSADPDGQRWTRASLGAESCVVVTDGLAEPVPGALNSDPVALDRIFAARLDPELCIRWVFGAGDGFNGDCRAERADRARALLDLRPLGWLEPAGVDSRWMVWGRGVPGTVDLPERTTLRRLHDKAR
jgi:hypothetical protein